MVIASIGHASTHNPHSMQSSGRATTDLRFPFPSSSNSKTAVGHDSLHAPIPSHLLGSTFAGIFIISFFMHFMGTYRVLRVREYILSDFSSANAARCTYDESYRSQGRNPWCGRYFRCFSLILIDI